MSDASLKNESAFFLQVLLFFVFFFFKWYEALSRSQHCYDLCSGEAMFLYISCTRWDLEVELCSVVDHCLVENILTTKIKQKIKNKLNKQQFYYFNRQPPS